MNHVGSSVNLHVVRDGKILLLRRISDKWMHDKLQIPGGKTEEGESPLVAVLREAKEELGIEARAEDVEHIATVAVKDGDNEYFALQFRLRNPEAHTYKIMEEQKCSELVWADLTALPDDTIDIFKTIIEQGVPKQNTYVEIGYSQPDAS